MIHSSEYYEDNRISDDFSRTFTDPYRDWKQIPTSCLGRSSGRGRRDLAASPSFQNPLSDL